MNDEISLDDNPLLRKVSLRHPDSFAPGERPTVSLHLLVKNGESCIGRLLTNVGPYINEIVAVVNDCTDRTVAILREYAEFRGTGFGLQIIEVTSRTNPDLYLLDVSETYATGQSLMGESLEGPFTGEPLLADWAGARNLGWSHCTKQWILFLDADDVVDDPESIPGICEAMEGKAWVDGVAVDEPRNFADLAESRYIYSATEDGLSRAEAFRERIVRNIPIISWVGMAHEVLKGARKTARMDGNLVVRDMRDSLGLGIRVPGRCLKVLYYYARLNDWIVSPRDLIYLGLEARPFMPAFALKVLEMYMAMSLWPEERAWACCLIGEIHEQAENFPAASEWYEKALTEFPGEKSAYRLCRSRFREEKWQQAIDAYNTGVTNGEEVALQLIDNGPIYKDMSKIMVASALEKLGRRNEAIDMVEEALKAFPQQPELILMNIQLKARI
jgi:glycosyltransferase involved in cell wall biosynthesis